jgi:hypothetical protein
MVEINELSLTAVKQSLKEVSKYLRSSNSSTSRRNLEFLRQSKNNGIVAKKWVDGVMLRHPVGNPKRKVLLSTAANLSQNETKVESN